MVKGNRLVQPLKRFAKSRIWAHRLKSCERRALPSFLVVGASKSGTTALHDNMMMHPDILPACTKEVHYFDVQFDKGECWYRAHFPTVDSLQAGRGDGPAAITGEASPYYLFHPHAPRRVAEVLPEVKLIALLRDPIDRAFSHYKMVVRNGNERLSFADAIEQEEAVIREEVQKMLDNPAYYSDFHRRRSYLTRGLYADQLEAWFEHFPREQMLVLKSEDYFSDSADTLNRIFDFLDLSRMTFDTIKKSGSAPRYKPMDPDLRARLNHYFAPANERLAELLGEDPGWS